MTEKSIAQKRVRTSKPPHLLDLERARNSEKVSDAVYLHLNKFPDHVARIIADYFGFTGWGKMGFKDIAEDLDITPRRVRIYCTKGVSQVIRDGKIEKEDLKWLVLDPRKRF